MRQQVWTVGSRYMSPTRQLLKAGEVASSIKTFKNIISKGGELVLVNSLDLVDEAAEIITPVFIDLNNKSVYGGIFAESNGQMLEGNTDSYVFWVKEGGELTIEGDGDIIAQEAIYSMAVWANGGNVIIKGGRFYNNGEGSDLIYASAGGNVYIYGGEFHPCQKQPGTQGTADEYVALNIKDADYKSGISKIVVYGGKFYGFNPANNKSEGPNTNFVADGYKSVEIEPNVWEVIKE